MGAQRSAGRPRPSRSRGSGPRLDPQHHRVGQPRPCWDSQCSGGTTDPGNRMAGEEIRARPPGGGHPRRRPWRRSPQNSIVLRRPVPPARRTPDESKPSRWLTRARAMTVRHCPSELRCAQRHQNSHVSRGRRGAMADLDRVFCPSVGITRSATDPHTRRRSNLSRCGGDQVGPGFLRFADVQW